MENAFTIDLNVGFDNQQIQEALNSIPGFQMSSKLYHPRTIDEKNPSAFCHFPFIYRGETFEKCIVDENNGVPWCSLTPTANRSSLGSWGNCSSAIGYGISIVFSSPAGNLQPLTIEPINLTGPGTHRNISHPEIKIPYTSVYTVVNGTTLKDKFRLSYGNTRNRLPGTATGHKGSRTIYTTKDILSMLKNLTYVVIRDAEIEIDPNEIHSFFFLLKKPWSGESFTGANIYYKQSTVINHDTYITYLLHAPMSQ